MNSRIEQKEITFLERILSKKGLQSTTNTISHSSYNSANEVLDNNYVKNCKDSVDQELEYDLYDYECHEYDTDVTSSWFVSTSTEVEQSCYNNVDPEDPWRRRIFDEERDETFRLVQEETEVNKDDHQCQMLKNEDEGSRQMKPPVACLEDLELWDG